MAAPSVSVPSSHWSMPASINPAQGWNPSYDGTPSNFYPSSSAAGTNFGHMQPLLGSYQSYEDPRTNISSGYAERRGGVSEPRETSRSQAPGPDGSIWNSNFNSFGSLSGPMTDVATQWTGDGRRGAVSAISNTGTPLSALGLSNFTNDSLAAMSAPGATAMTGHTDATGMQFQRPMIGQQPLPEKIDFAIKQLRSQGPWTHPQISDLCQSYVSRLQSGEMESNEALASMFSGAQAGIAAQVEILFRKESLWNHFLNRGRRSSAEKLVGKFDPRKNSVGPTSKEVVYLLGAKIYTYLQPGGDGYMQGAPAPSMQSGQSYSGSVPSTLAPEQPYGTAQQIGGGYQQLTTDNSIAMPGGLNGGGPAGDAEDPEEVISAQQKEIDELQEENWQLGRH